MTLKTQWLGSFTLKGHYCIIEVGNEGQAYKNKA